MLTADDILEALRACFDPATGVNVVDLGMVREVVLHADEDAPGAGIVGVPARQTLSLRVLTATEDDDMWEMLRAQVMNRMAGVEGLTRIAVERVAQESWAPAMASAAGRRALGLDEKLFPILNNKGPAGRRA